MSITCVRQILSRIAIELNSSRLEDVESDDVAVITEPLKKLMGMIVESIKHCAKLCDAYQKKSSIGVYTARFSSRQSQ